MRLLPGLMLHHIPVGQHPQNQRMDDMEDCWRLRPSNTQSSWSYTCYVAHSITLTLCIPHCLCVVKTDFHNIKWVCPRQESSNEIWDWGSIIRDGWVTWGTKLPGLTLTGRKVYTSVLIISWSTYCWVYTWNMKAYTTVNQLLREYFTIEWVWLHG